MSEDKEDVSQDERFSQNRRRAYIIRQLRARGAVSLARLSVQAATTIRQKALERDIEALNSQGFSIETIESDGRPYLVDAAARHIGSKVQRMDLNSNGKGAIGMAACSLLLGLPDTPGKGELGAPAEILDKRRRETMERTNAELTDLLTRSEILAALRQNLDFPDAMAHAMKVHQKLQELWQESSFSVFCDAGTTNENFALRLTDVLLPSAFSPLRNLSVCSNSRSIFNILGDPEVPVKAICTGGRQIGIDGLTEAIAGGLTETFLNSTAGVLDFAACFMGTTSIDVSLGYINSDSWEEKAIKEIVMGDKRSRLRVVVADRSKFTVQPMREGYRFASIQNGQVDLIITNSRMTGKESPQQKGGELSGADDLSSKLIDAVRTRGVPVIEISWNRAPGNIQSEMRRGKLFPIRVPNGAVEDLFAAAHGINPSDDFITSAKNERYLSYPTRTLETWVAAAVELFLANEGNNFTREKVIERFNQLKEKTFFGSTGENPVA